MQQPGWGERSDQSGLFSPSGERPAAKRGHMVEPFAGGKQRKIPLRQAAWWWLNFRLVG